MINSLPDVNVWLALAVEGHVHHAAARDWFLEQQDGSVAFCRVTQLGMLRLLTNPSVMGQGSRTVGEAWDVYTHLRVDRRVRFLPDADGVDPSWRILMTQPGVGPSSWTDAYLASVAVANSLTLVTFDGGFARWSMLTLRRP